MIKCKKSIFAKGDFFLVSLDVDAQCGKMGVRSDPLLIISDTKTPGKVIFRKPKYFEKMCTHTNRHVPT